MQKKKYVMLVVSNLGPHHSCECKNIWTSKDDMGCGNVIAGCPPVACDADENPW